MDAETRARLESDATDRERFAEGWTGHALVKQMELQHVADIRAALAELDALDLSRVTGFATKNGVLTLYTTEESMRNRIGESDTWTRAGWVDAVERVEIHDDGT